jgi:hypothetical protein
MMMMNVGGRLEKIFFAAIRLFVWEKYRSSDGCILY